MTRIVTEPPRCRPRDELPQSCILYLSVKHDLLMADKVRVRRLEHRSERPAITRRDAVVAHNVYEQVRIVDED